MQTSSDGSSNALWPNRAIKSGGAAHCYSLGVTLLRCVPAWATVALLVLAAALLLVPESAPRTADAAICSPGGVCYGVSKLKGFDVCAAPTAGQMSTWWHDSPYYDVGIYIGGSERACSQPNLTSSWISTVNGYGWDFYLTWVGPQAVCTQASDISDFISTNTTTAFNQGKAEALGAASAASSLAIYGRKIFYYDIEAYSGSATCRDSVKSFLSGWCYELRTVLTHKCGVYGSPCNATDWVGIQYVPDDVWLADWNQDPDVWGLACLNNGYWSGDQRLHQYQKYPFVENHIETYGGVSLLVDNDCAKGLVTPNGHGGTDTACTVE